ncbi:MAG TPA: histidine phosphatase family protein [Noviherbaspirillum sp.]|jgi:phosphohistidine phosphatase SixA|uniref:histidine phosphatase family protein n=1 Tax=Noviherbaspirillum sp. TaxID=1926288 RepID=UPI002DDD2205|nr:histidine phosphatase family protein [Noviherbaspirillum sp.]HEV2610972.1 histidine phosphatase family protein [Noviherbaspirillum sp.]
MRRLRLLAFLLSCMTAHFYAEAAPESIPDAASSAPDAARAIPLHDLASALRNGGYVVYFRHAATDFSKPDGAMKGYDDCANQRMLSSDGRKAARAIGERIRALKLPVGEVLASPYCRTMETATLAFGQATPKSEIRESQGGDYAGLKRLFASPVAQGTNRWIVGHGTPYRAVAGPPHLAEGEAAVMLPQPSGWTVVARVTQEQWREMR